MAPGTADAPAVNLRAGTSGLTVEVARGGFCGHQTDRDWRWDSEARLQHGGTVLLVAEGWPANAGFTMNSCARAAAPQRRLYRESDSWDAPGGQRVCGNQDEATASSEWD